MRNNAMIGLGVFFVATTLIMFAIVDQTSDTLSGASVLDTIFSILVIINFVGALVLFFLYNSAWLKFRAQQEIAEQNEYQMQLHRAPAPGPWPVAAGNPMVLNINTATDGQLYMLGLPHDVVVAILSTRQLVGQFVNFEHLLLSTRIPEPYLLPIKDRLIYSAVLPPTWNS